jgi:hypothetical protein
VLAYLFLLGSAQLGCYRLIKPWQGEDIPTIGRFGEPGPLQMAQATEFHHSKLPDDTDSLRLLKVLYAPPETEVVKCTLEIFELDQAPPYIALSYTWGKPFHDDCMGIGMIDWQGALCKIIMNEKLFWIRQISMTLYVPWISDTNGFG